MKKSSPKIRPQNPSKPITLSKISASAARKIRGVAFDIDDTFSSHGKITREAFTALWDLHQAGYYLIPVTGRPSGWCDHIVRFWPVHGVVGENGAFFDEMQNGKRMRIYTPSTGTKKSPQKSSASVATPSNSASSAQNKDQLWTLIRKNFPDATLASDQAFREFDLAVDIAEAVTEWPREKVQRLVSLAESQGAHAKVSSIHVNIWFGDHDKKSGFANLLINGLKADKKFPRQLEEWVFLGDSPNDAPMFRYFPFSIGVANVKKFLDQMKDFPTALTTKESGKGFHEFSRWLLKNRGRKKT